MALQKQCEQCIGSTSIGCAASVVHHPPFSLPCVRFASVMK